ncbi:unnamed protein product [Anisakis simplex]|uniref:SUI1 domain-containing protein n=1 Tax=Anisakis simplex TaxID=6269 RepID=A0A0M3JS50_ANISI|nr:unnamed protein product [Anisakis simplex]
MSGKAIKKATADEKSSEKRNEAIVDNASKINDKNEQSDSMKIELKADKEVEGDINSEEELKEITATDITPENSEHDAVLTAQDYRDDVHEFDADPLRTWSQSSGNEQLRLIVNVQPALPLVEAVKTKVVNGRSPSIVVLNENMLEAMKKHLRSRSQLGDMHTHICIQNQRSNSERRGIIAKLFDESLQQYLSSSTKHKRQICMRIECGGNEAPSLQIRCAIGNKERQYYKRTNQCQFRSRINDQDVCLLNLCFFLSNS